MNIPTTSLPIVQRELLVSSRKRFTFWSRMIAAGLAFLGVFFVLGLSPTPTAAAAMGANLFRSLSMVAFWTCLFGGALLTADCLSVEKREGTLGLVFLTDLKGYDVVIGKLVAKSLVAVFCVLAIVPMLALPVLLGGVTGLEFFCVILSLFNTLFVSLSIGMIVSVFSREPRNAMAVASFIVLLWLFIPMAAASSLPLAIQASAYAFSPYAPFSSAFALGIGGGSVTMFIMSTLLQHGLGWLCLRSASRRVQTCWHDEPKKRKAKENSQTESEGRLALRRALLPINAVLWLESRNTRVRKVVLGLFVVVAVSCWLLNHHSVFHWRNAGYAVPTVIFLHLFLKLLVAFSASTRLIEARRDGALSMVLSTRMTVADIVRGEFLAIQRLFGWAVIILLIFDVFWLGAVIRYDRVTEHIYGAVMLFVGWIVVLFANCAGLVWRALYHSLHTKRPYRAALRAFLEIAVLPFAWSGFVVAGISGSIPPGQIILLFVVLNLLNTTYFAHGAYYGLQKELRDLLVDVPPPPPVLGEFDEDYALLK
jgi:hypothetical protein